MPSATLFTLLDDIATLFDDVAVATKGAAVKTAGVVGDDIALNADQVIGVDPRRELPVVARVAWGSLKNKALLIPLMLGLGAASGAIPWLLPTLLMIGGAWLCYEGAEKLLHARSHKEEQQEHVQAIRDVNIDPREAEKRKIKGAIRTDFILSGEIMAITLNMALSFDLRLGGQFLTLLAISVALTFAIYGTVALFVKIDDIGLKLASHKGDSVFAKMVRATGVKAINMMPGLMKAVSTIGMLAMFAVGGELVVHGIPVAEHVFENLAHGAQHVPVIGGVLDKIAPYALGTIAGLVTGLLAVMISDRLVKLWPSPNIQE